MKAAYYDQYGGPDVVSVKELPKPKPNDDEVLVRVKATSVTAADSRIRGARFPKGFGIIARLAVGVFGPRKKILGGTFSGVIEEVGANVLDFIVGDEVCGMTGFAMGTHAQYIVIRSNKAVVKKPKSVSHNDAAGALFGGTTALFFLRDKAKLQKGESVLVNGASGAVGSNVVQIAKSLGATVSGVTSTDNLKLVKSLGADSVIDYKKQNILESGKHFDVVVDCVGNIGIKEGVALLAPKGRLALVVANFYQILGSIFNGKVLAGSAFERPDDIKIVLDLLEKKSLKNVVDSTYSLEQIVKAHERVDSGQKVGNVIIEIK